MIKVFNFVFKNTTMIHINSNMAVLACAETMFFDFKTLVFCDPYLANKHVKSYHIFAPTAMAMHISRIFPYSALQLLS